MILWGDNASVCGSSEVESYLDLLARSVETSRVGLDE